MPVEPIENFDPARTPDPENEASFHSDAEYVFSHLGAEIIPKVNGILELINGALVGDAVTVLDSLATLNPLIGSFCNASLGAGSTPDAIEIETGLALSALVVGQRIEFQAASVNTGPTTIDIDGIGPVEARTITGAQLPAGFIRTDVRTSVYYDGAVIVVRREIQVGTGANGSWRRYEDGRQVCHHKLTGLGPVTASDANGFYSGGFAWTFPAQFTATPAVWPSPQRQSTSPPGIWASRREASNTSQAFLLHSNSALNVTNIAMDVEATGSWY